MVSFVLVVYVQAEVEGCTKMVDVTLRDTLPQAIQSGILALSTYLLICCDLNIHFEGRHCTDSVVRSTSLLLLQRAPFHEPRTEAANHTALGQTSKLVLCNSSVFNFLRKIHTLVVNLHPIGCVAL